MQVIDFKTTPYFSGSITILGYLLIGFGIPLLVASILGGLILIFIAFIIFSTHYRLRVDLQNKTYHDYLWILGFRIGERGKFQSIEYMFIKKSALIQTMRLRVASSTIRKEVYDGYLRFSEIDKIHLRTMDSKENIIHALRPIADMLQVEILDYSEK